MTLDCFSSFSEEDPNDSGIESSGGHPTLERRASSKSEVFTPGIEENSWPGQSSSSCNSCPTSCQPHVKKVLN